MPPEVRVMRNFVRKVAYWLELDTEDGVAAVEYTVIVGLVVGGILSWFFRW
jgi:Flp pilus assembly pilin Flp